MTQSVKDKGLVKEVMQYVKSNRNLLAAVSLSLALVGFGVRFMSHRVHPDLRRVLQLRTTIQKSYPNALKTLQTLNIQKRILTDYGPQSQHNPSQPQLNMLYLVITRLNLKQSNKQNQLRNPFLPPFQQGIFISELQPTHRLLYNKFNIYKNHLLVVTKEFQAQANQLNEMDFRQSILVLKALNGLMFYNSGKQAGSSQPHKHIQVFPMEALQLPIVQRLSQFVKQSEKKYDFEQQSIIEFPCFNFIHGLIILKPDTSLSTSKKQMHNAYKRIMSQKIHPINAKAYNIIATQEFILVIARLKQKAFDEIAVNAVGFMGSMLFKNQQLFNKYLSLKIKPHSILQDITYPKGYMPVRGQQKEQQQKALT